MKHGLLEGEARDVRTKSESKSWGQSMININVVGFRLVRFDQNMKQLPPIQVEMRGTRMVGSVADGDIVQIRDGYDRSGVLMPKKIFNKTTSTIVTTKMPNSPVVTFIVFIIFIAIVLFAISVSGR